ncbi:hypothetical protein [Marisediminicola sp. LYQ85]|uniref:hypothetical protein n=1 Tax=Marisediminicola sp. LYQ85 TaxID=3391062 RepID=UPI0039839E39
MAGSMGYSISRLLRVCLLATLVALGWIAFGSTLSASAAEGDERSLIGGHASVVDDTVSGTVAGTVGSVGAPVKTVTETVDRTVDRTVHAVVTKVAPPAPAPAAPPAPTAPVPVPPAPVASAPVVAAPTAPAPVHAEPAPARPAVTESAATGGEPAGVVSPIVAEVTDAVDVAGDVAGDVVAEDVLSAGLVGSTGDAVTGLPLVAPTQLDTVVSPLTGAVDWALGSTGRIVDGTVGATLDATLPGLDSLGVGVDAAIEPIVRPIVDSVVDPVVGPIVGPVVDPVFGSPPSAPPLSPVVARNPPPVSDSSGGSVNAAAFEAGAPARGEPVSSRERADTLGAGSPGSPVTAAHTRSETSVVVYTDRVVVNPVGTVGHDVPGAPTGGASTTSAASVNATATVIGALDPFAVETHLLSSAATASDDAVPASLSPDPGSSPD